jgi:16S rRNA (cytosine967-C5)-methyltransferase
MSAVSPARRAAFAILKAIDKGRGHSDDLLRGKNVAALSAADRNLTTALVLGVLRRQIDLDRRIRLLLKHPDAKLDSEVLIALRLGAFQLLQMDRIPVHAVVGESVELTKQAGHRFASGMVNAVLRRLADARREPADEMSADDCRRAHPAWMVDRWKATYGDEAIAAICRHGQTQPSLTVRITEDSVEQELAAEGVELRPGELLTSARQVVAGDVTKIAALREGRVRIQDEGSQLIAELVPRGPAMLDCCAAPGGKTLILAERNPDARIVAFEASAERLAQLRERLKPLERRVQCTLADATAIEDDSAFDVALADVPCSGTGTLGRNPEIRHRLQPDDLPRQAARQEAILRAALHAVRPGGYVLYSTCSLEPEENDEVVKAVLSERADARLVPLQGRIEELRAEGILVDSGVEHLMESLTTEGTLRLLPGVLATDGFYAALLSRDA